MSKPCLDIMKYLIVPCTDDLLVLIHRFLLKYVIFWPIWAQIQGFGPKFGLRQMMIYLTSVKTVLLSLRTQDYLLQETSQL